MKPRFRKSRKAVLHVGAPIPSLGWKPEMHYRIRAVHFSTGESAEGTKDTYAEACARRAELLSRGAWDMVEIIQEEKRT